ncbi:ATP-dependent helicase [Schaalia sp. lx-260]|uniref:ATP-dependent helicase n=1 Tax=Schaalia sp. lx-260 TaxID=2899082 RepID=UPI001E4CD008|nr:ATP-dependent DNA helicase [Schaalia sp. lx-260]MCD4549090.1 ATP-dependent helicase [Schaalia sp. lx-260]
MNHSIVNMREAHPFTGDSSLTAKKVQVLATPQGEKFYPPTCEQAKVIESETLPLLVVAGAGAGKTTTMSMRVLWLIANKGFAPESILGLTFSRKSAGELGYKMRQDLQNFIANTGYSIEGEPIAATYNSFAQNIVREHGMHIHLDPDLQLIGSARACEIMTHIVESWQDDLPEDMALSVIVNKTLQLSGQIADHNLSVESARKELEYLNDDFAEISPKPSDPLKKILSVNRARLQLLDFVEAYAAYKREEGLIDFSDQLLLATQIVHKAPEVVQSLRQEYRAVLLDEFQDTSVVQMELLSTIFHDHPVTAVGDPNQAIYGWRGASASSLESFLHRFHTGTPHMESQSLTLSTAWRNSRQILVAANAIAQPLRNHSTYAKSPILNPQPQAENGTVTLTYPLEREKQIQDLVDFVKKVHHPLPPSDRHDNRRWTSTAILCRRRRDIPEIARALRDEGISTYVFGLGGLLSEPAVRDVRAALELSADVGASRWIMRLLAARDIGTSDIAVLHAYARELARQRDPEAEHVNVFLLDAIDNVPPVGWCKDSRGPRFTQAAHTRVRILGQQLRKIREGNGRSLTEQVERAIRILGMTEDLIADPLQNNGREALDAFVDTALKYETEVPYAHMRGFLSWLEIAEEEENGLEMPSTVPEEKAVHILTVHAAKGLEWDSVAVASLVDSLFPEHRSRTSVPWTDNPPKNNGWLMKHEELPAPLRGDYKDLPSLCEHEETESMSAYFSEKVREVQASNSRATESSVFKQHLESEVLPAFGAHAEREERRLAYVAFTRARTHMFLTGSWMGYGKQPRYPSRYLMEAQAELLSAFRQKHDESSPWIAQITQLPVKTNEYDNDIREEATSLENAGPLPSGNNSETSTHKGTCETLLAAAPENIRADYAQACEQREHITVGLTSQEQQESLDRLTQHVTHYPNEDDIRATMTEPHIKLFPPEAGRSRHDTAQAAQRVYEHMERTHIRQEKDLLMTLRLREEKLKEALRMSNEQEMRRALIGIIPLPVNEGPVISTHSENEEQTLQIENDSFIQYVSESLELTQDTRALLEERQYQAEQRKQNLLPIHQVAATRLSALTTDPEKFARMLRRPIPTEPISSATLGTIFHKWVEKQLRVSSALLWDEALPEAESLSEKEREKLERLQKHWKKLDILIDRNPVAVEEPFSIEIAGISVHGRMDAVLRDRNGHDMVIDWKTGRPVGPKTPPEHLMEYVLQLRLYRKAWARRQRKTEKQVEACIAFLDGPRVFSLQELEQFLGSYAHTSIEEMVSTVFGQNTKTGTFKENDNE